VHRLNVEKISNADAEWPEGRAPLARMLKKVFGSVGLAWVDPDERVEITAAGVAFLSSRNPADVLSQQLSRFQFWNPSVKSKVHREIKLHPIPFLGELLRSVDGQSITAVEYSLFVARAKVIAELDESLRQIDAFRELNEEQQAQLVETCKAYMLGGRRRKSIYNTISLNRPYALKVWALSHLIEKTEKPGLKLRKGALKDYRSYLADYQREGTYIEFANDKDWIAYFGNPEATPTIGTALEYYVKAGDVDAAISIKKKTAKTKREFAVFGT
jgi:hypothetical protein